MSFGRSTSVKPTLRHVTNGYEVRQKGRTMFLRTTAVPNAIVCNCAGSYSAYVYDPFNRTTYLSPAGQFTGSQFLVQTVTAGLQLGPTLALPLPPLSDPTVFLGLQIIPLTGGAQGRLLLAWSEFPSGPKGPAPRWVSRIHDLSTAGETDAFNDQQAENSGQCQVPSSSPDGQSVYAQAMTVYSVSCCLNEVFGIQSGPVSLYQTEQAPGASPDFSRTAITNVPEPYVVTPAVAHDDQFVYLEAQAANLGTFYVPLGPLYIYRANPNTLEPVGGIDFINSGLQRSFGLDSTGPVAADSYAFTGCTGAQTGSFCPP